MKRLKKDNLHSLLAFINSHWKENHVFVQNPGVFNYLYLRNHGKYNFFIKEWERKIVAMIGVIEASKEAIWLTTWRSIGIQNHGVELFNQVLDKYNPSFIGSIGINKRVEKFYKIIGWKVITLDHYYLEKTNNKTEGTLKYIFTKSPRVNQLYDDKYSPRKNDDYLIKRYILNPHFDYYFLFLEDVKLVFVGRIVEYLNKKVFHCVDFFGEIDKKSIRAVLQDFLHNNSFDLFEMMCYCSDSPSIDLELKDDSIIIPTYFSPFIFENINITCAYKADIDKSVKIVLGDSDQDRPN